MGIVNNPAWESVNALKWNNSNYDLVKFNVPVVYETVEKIVSQIWENIKPEVNIIFYMNFWN